MMTMERNWTTTGAAYNGTDEQRERLGRIFDSLQWQEIPCTLPMMQGEAIKAAIRELRLPKASHVADSHELAPYGLVAIRCHYKNGDAQVYILDEGVRLVVLASDFWPNA